ncbi:hypothetical protein ACWGRV_39380 [Streptomyces sp. NPDC055663]
MSGGWAAGEAPRWAHCEAEQRNIHGRSKMDKKQLANALGH